MIKIKKKIESYKLAFKKKKELLKCYLKRIVETLLKVVFLKY